jgi:hypothetical protein
LIQIKAGSLRCGIMAAKGVRAMPITDIVVVSVITLAFVVFAVALAWGDRQTREIARASRERALTGDRIASFKQSLAGVEGAASKGKEKSKVPV